MDAFQRQIQLPLDGPSIFPWGSREVNGTHLREKRKLEPDENEVVERLNGFVLSPNSLKKLRTRQAGDVSSAPTFVGSTLAQHHFDGPQEIEEDCGPTADDVQQRAFMVQLPSPTSPDGSPPQGTQNAIIPYPGHGLFFPPSPPLVEPASGNSDLMQALDLTGRGGAEASAALDIPRRLVRNSSCSSLPRSLFFNFKAIDPTAAEMEEDEVDPNSKAVIPWAPPPLVLQQILGAAREREEVPMEEEMEDVGGPS